MSRGKIDDVDRSILERLSQDGRRSNRDIAQELDLGEGTVRGRVKRMQQEGIIKIMALTSFTGPVSPQLAYIGIRADLKRVAETARLIAALGFVRFVASMMGRYEIFAIVLVRDGAELVRLVNEEIMPLPGVRHADTTLVVKNLKYDYRWGRIVGRAVSLSPPR